MSDLAIQEAFASQGRACAKLGSPFMGRLMPLIGARLTNNSAVAHRVLTWPGDTTAAGQSVPLRLAGALHGLVLDGSDAGLVATYPPNAVPDDMLWAAVEEALHRHEERIMAWLDQAPQTNEVRRAVGLIPGISWALSQFDLPIELWELGASAGLNLGLDCFHMQVGDIGFGPPASPVKLAPDWAGPMPTPRDIRVIERRGVDLNPLDLRDPDQALRLCAYLWPDQTERMARTKAAMGLHRTPLDAGDAGDWLARCLPQPHPGRLRVVFHTIAWQYFPPSTQAKARGALEAAGANATAEAPLLHLAMEADGTPKSAALTAEIWPKSKDGQGAKVLARIDYHGRWINWLDP